MHIHTHIWASSLHSQDSGALHHGIEPVLHPGAGVPHALPPPAAVQGHPEGHQEEGHLPQQELPGFAPGPGPAAEQEAQNLLAPVTAGSRESCHWTSHYICDL